MTDTDRNGRPMTAEEVADLRQWQANLRKRMAAEALLDRIWTDASKPEADCGA
jgi:hypothetical protein